MVARLPRALANAPSDWRGRVQRLPDFIPTHPPRTRFLNRLLESHDVSPCTPGGDTMSDLRKRGEAASCAGVLGGG